MAIIRWDKKYELNIPEIDDQHKKLVELINELYEAMLKGKGKEVLSDVIQGLEKYTIEHFKFEERLMLRNNYISLSDHKDKHKEFVDHIKEYREKFDAGDRSLSVDIVKFLKNWLFNHINVRDRDYVKYMSK